MTLEEIVKSGVKLTPMMDQYYEIKKNYESTLLLFRMGDFYEVFFQDAIDASKLLNITLTHRGKLGGHPIPMAGIPHHAAATYIDRLTKLGKKCAICEQVEDPKEAKGIVKRAVTQVVSPGMPFCLEKYNNPSHNFMISIGIDKKNFHLVAIDYTTGDFFGQVFTNIEELINSIHLLSPGEIVTYFNQFEENPQIDQVLTSLSILKTNLREDYFNLKYTDIYIEKLISNYKKDKTIERYKNILGPVGALSYYIDSTQVIENYCQIKPFKVESTDSFLKISMHSLQGLEILPKSFDSYKDSLLGHFDKTKSSLGTRKLKEIFTTPLLDLSKIEQRQNVISNFIANKDLLEACRDELSKVRDLERILTKVGTNKVTASDLINTKNSFKVLMALESKLKKIDSEIFKPLKQKEKAILNDFIEKIELGINEEIGASLDKGNLIKDAYDKKRDKLKKLSNNTAESLIELENRYKQETGIPKLRIKSNNVAGHFIEISKTHSDKVPEHFKRRQTLVNCERFVTEELTEFEKEVVTAKEKLYQLEREIFNNFVSIMSDNSSLIQEVATKLGLIDVFQSLSYIALQDELSRPKLSSKKINLEVKGAFHPLIKSILKDEFVTHDLNLNQFESFGLITGPNMAGKTTVMREMAIIQLLAQIGSFVPAKSAKLGVCDFLFSRLGASDDILRGQSTFMVEMSETAEILRHATNKSLIILDEVGRGTSTYDGLSIAWALVEHIANKIGALTLFATHYHELIELANTLTNAKNLTVETFNEGDDVQFLYRLIEKPASESFGIYVAKLAGIPNSVLTRSSEILSQLESEKSSKQVSENLKQTINSAIQLPLFGSDPEIETELNTIKDSLKEIDLNDMTPIDALNKLNSLKEQFLH